MLTGENVHNILLREKILLQYNMHRKHHFAKENIHRKKTRRMYIKILRISEDNGLHANFSFVFFNFPRFCTKYYFIVLKTFLKKNSFQSNFASHFLHYFTPIISKGNGIPFTIEVSFNRRDAVFPVTFKNSKNM